MSKHPETDLNEVITRIRNELAQQIHVIKQIKLILSSDPEFDGLSIIGGVKAILRRYKEEKEKNFELERELKRFISKRPYG